MSTLTRSLWWATSWALTHPWHVIGGYVLLQNPATRAWTLRMTGATLTGTIAAARTTSAITAEELVIPFLASPKVQAGVGLALGVTSGMVVGTAIAQTIWGDEGARDALTFYGFDAGIGDAHYLGTKDDPGYFNIPGNVSKIWEHYV